MSSRPRLRGASRAAAEEWLLLLLPLAFSAFVYRRLTHVYFFADDFLNLFRIVNDDLVQYLLLPHGGHLLATRNALFFAFYWAFGMRAEYWFWVVLITHLVNVYLLFRTIRWLTGSARLAAFGAALWGTCPVQVGALGWYSVYGQVVVGSILLLLLCRAARAGAEARPPSRYLRRDLATSASGGVHLLRRRHRHRAGGAAGVLPAPAALAAPHEAVHRPDTARGGAADSLHGGALAFDPSSSGPTPRPSSPT